MEDSHTRRQSTFYTDMYVCCARPNIYTLLMRVRDFRLNWLGSGAFFVVVVVPGHRCAIQHDFNLIFYSIFWEYFILSLILVTEDV